MLFVVWICSLVFGVCYSLFDVRCSSFVVCSWLCAGRCLFCVDACRCSLCMVGCLWVVDSLCVVVVHCADACLLLLGVCCCFWGLCIVGVCCRGARCVSLFDRCGL